MKRVLWLLLVSLAFLPPAGADTLELGFGIAPLPGSSETGKEASVLDNSLKVLRLGYTTWGVINFSLDSIIMPPFVVEAMTGRWEEDPMSPYGGYWKAGYYRPGMVNLFDVGLKLDLSGIVLGAQMGFNSLYVYKMDEIQAVDPDFSTGMGVNLKLTGGVKISDYLGVEFNFYSIQPDFGTAINVVQGLFSSDSDLQAVSQEKLLQTAAYSLMLVLYLGGEE